MICAVLHWDLQRVMQLTWPQFEYVSLQLHRLQYMTAKNEVYFGICGALGNAENLRNLLDSAGDFTITDEPDLTYTPEELAAAMERADRIIAEQQAKEKNKHGN